MLRELSTKGGVYTPGNTGFNKVAKEWSLLGKRVMRHKEE
jgi:hypothetical protein